MFNASILKNRNTSLFKTNIKETNFANAPDCFHTKVTLSPPLQTRSPTRFPPLPDAQTRAQVSSWTLSLPRIPTVTRSPSCLPDSSFCPMSFLGLWAPLSPPDASHLSPPCLPRSLRHHCIQTSLTSVWASAHFLFHPKSLTVGWGRVLTAGTHSFAWDVL